MFIRKRFSTPDSGIITLVIFLYLPHHRGAVEPSRKRMTMNALFYKLAINLRNDARGQDLVEYALMAGFVAVAAGAIFPQTLMPGVSTIFSKINDFMTKSAAQGS